MNFWLTASTKGDSTRLFHKWIDFCHFGSSWGKPDWLVNKFPQNWRWSLFLVATTQFFCKGMCTITIKQHNRQFSFLRRRIQHVRADFALFTVAETGNFVGWKVNTFFVDALWKKHISNNILNWILRLFENKNPLTNFRKIELVSYSQGILRTWHVDDQGKPWQPLLPRDWNVFLCTQSICEHSVFGQYTFTISLRI